MKQLHGTIKQQSPTLFLRVAIVLLALAIAAVCVFALPVGIRDPEAGGYRVILAGLYVPAVPFFAGLYQALLLLEYIDKSQAFSDKSIRALKRIKYYAIVISALFAAGMPYIYQVANRDDAPGVVALGLAVTFASLVIATFAAVLQKLLQSGMDLKLENDLTV